LNSNNIISHYFSNVNISTKNHKTKILKIKEENGGFMRYTKIILAIILLFSVCLMTVCASSPEAVKLTNKSNILTYAKHTYGLAEHVSQKSGENSITHTLKDKEYGFVYTIKSYAEAVGMDGSVFWYSENKSSNFEKKYQEYMLSQLDDYIKEKEKETNVVFEKGKYPDIFFAEIYITETTDISKAIDFIKELGQKLCEIDTRGYWKNNQITLMHENGYDKIGAFFFNNKVYKSVEEENVDYYMDRASQIMNIKEHVFLYQKPMHVNNVPGLKNEELVHVLGSDMTNINCYYFEYQGKDYIIASINVYEENGDIHQYIYCISDETSMTGKIPKK
jgi:hypothetical protein